MYVLYSIPLLIFITISIYFCKPVRKIRKIISKMAYHSNIKNVSISEPLIDLSDSSRVILFNNPFTEHTDDIGYYLSDDLV